MFKWLNKQGVESDAGFVVQGVSRFVIEYRQGHKKISVSMEVENATSANVEISIQKSSFARWDDGVIIPEKEQLQLIENFKDAMNFQDIGVTVYD